MWLVEVKDVEKAVVEVVAKAVVQTMVVATLMEVKVLNVKFVLSRTMMLRSAGTGIILILLCNMLLVVTLYHSLGHQVLTLL
jgi:hypothetical protein